MYANRGIEMQPFISRDIPVVDHLAGDIVEGLSKETNKKWIKPKYLYDEIGSSLFERICDQPEYYPFRTETGILQRFRRRIVDFINGDVTVVELGSGNSVKTRILLSSLLERQKHVFYLPIDVSKEILVRTARDLNRDFTRLNTITIAADYVKGVREARNIIVSTPNMPEKKIVLFLGSTIGNFEHTEASGFLMSLRDCMQTGDILLLGFDLEKDSKLLEDAYNDKCGFTAAFNLNLLSRINRELGGEFRSKEFRHLAYYNLTCHRIEMNLISKMSQEVYVDRVKKSFSFSENERIHTENSYKFTLQQVRELVEHSGFRLAENLLDNNNWYCVALMTAES
jgi:L-histidine Nalpha-methyltransferase